MTRIARVVVLAFSALMLGAMVPQQADGQIVVKVGGRRHYHHHYYYRHGHRYWR